VYTANGIEFDQRRGRMHEQRIKAREEELQRVGQLHRRHALPQRSELAYVKVEHHHRTFLRRQQLAVIEHVRDVAPGKQIEQYALQADQIAFPIAHLGLV